MLGTVPTFVLPSFLLLEHVKTLELVFTILFRIWDILLNFVKFSVSVKYWVVDENLQMSFFFIYLDFDRCTIWWRSAYFFCLRALSLIIFDAVVQRTCEYFTTKPLLLCHMNCKAFFGNRKWHLLILSWNLEWSC